MRTWTHPALKRKRRCAVRKSLWNDGGRTRGPRSSGKSSEKRIHSVSQIVPGDLDSFLDSSDIAVVGILEFLDAILKLGEASTNEFEFPIMFEFYIDLLAREAILQDRDAAGEILDFGDSALEIGLPELHHHVRPLRGMELAGAPEIIGRTDR